MDLENRLNNNQLEYLEKIKPDFREIDTFLLYEWLVDLFQSKGPEDIERNKDLLLLEQIINIVAEI